MFARVTTIDVDPQNLSPDLALGLFERLVAPELRKQAGYAGVYVLRRADRLALLISLWETEAAAVGSELTGYYGEQMAKFAPLWGSPPGHDYYEVVFSDMPSPDKSRV